MLLGIIRGLETLCDVIEYGPVEAIKINTSVFPEAERAAREVRKSLDSSSKSDEKSKDDKAKKKTEKENVADPNIVDEEEELTSRKAKLLAAKPRGGRYIGAGGMLLWLEENGWDFEAEERMYAAKDAAAKAGGQKALPVIAEYVANGTKKGSDGKDRKLCKKTETYLEESEEEMISKAISEKGCW